MSISSPLGGHHAAVVVDAVLGVVDDPSVAAVEILVVLVIFVAIFVLAHQSSNLYRNVKLSNKSISLSGGGVPNVVCNVVSKSVSLLYSKYVSYLQVICSVEMI